MMWKILTLQIKEEIYYLLVYGRLFPDGQKGCYRGSRGIGDLLDIDQHILKETKTRWKKVAIAWNDYKKSYDMFPQTWIIECLKMYKISDSHKLQQESHKNWKVELTAGRKL